jgi:hypothetical protein
MSENIDSSRWAVGKPNPKLFSVDSEDGKRLELLGAVTVTEKGIAVCENRISGAVMQLAAVRVADGSVAEHVPFQSGEDGKLNMPLPKDRPSKVGFFMGYAGPQIVSSAVRLGEYPGDPLITTSSRYSFDPAQEIMLSLGGVKPHELDEQQWAEQVKLYGELGFNPSQSRGLFSKFHRDTYDSDEWNGQRLVVVPKDMQDLVETPGSDVRSDVFQVLGYETEVWSTITPPAYNSEPAVKMDISDLGVGFGRKYQTQASLGGISVVSLQTAFEVNIVAAS